MTAYVPSTLRRAAKIEAARRGTTVSALVTDALHRELARTADESEAAQ